MGIMKWKNVFSLTEIIAEGRIGSELVENSYTHEGEESAVSKTTQMLKLHL